MSAGPWLRIRTWLSRNRLDSEIATGAALDDPLRRHRAAVLVDPKTRARLAAHLEDVLSRVDRHQQPVEPTAAPMDRTAIEEARPLLVDLVRELRDPGPVSPIGVARTKIMLTHGASPLYEAGEPRELGPQLKATRASLHLGPTLEDAG
jgi:hypothetical protein